jgi:predicted TIM-barrel fold metal-dependent hydrolase
MTIDVWMQHPTARFLRHEMFESLRRWTGEAIPEGEIPLETTVAAMDAGGVELGILSAWHAPEGPLISNDEVAGFVEDHPDRFVALAAVDLLDPMGAVRELRRCVRELGFKGLRVIPWLWGLPPDDRRYYPLYAECVELGVPFCLQVGHTGPLRSSEPGRPIPYTTRRYPPELVRYLQADGRKKVLFGSNFPMIAPEKALADLDRLGIDDETRDRFLAGNARRVFDL